MIRLLRAIAMGIVEVFITIPGALVLCLLGMILVGLALDWLTRTGWLTPETIVAFILAVLAAVIVGAMVLIGFEKARDEYRRLG